MDFWPDICRFLLFTAAWSDGNINTTFLNNTIQFLIFPCMAWRNKHMSSTNRYILCFSIIPHHIAFLFSVSETVAMRTGTRRQHRCWWRRKTMKWSMNWIPKYQCSREEPMICEGSSQRMTGDSMTLSISWTMHLDCWHRAWTSSVWWWKQEEPKQRAISLVLSSWSFSFFIGFSRGNGHSGNTCAGEGWYDHTVGNSRPSLFIAFIDLLRVSIYIACNNQWKRPRVLINVHKCKSFNVQIITEHPQTYSVSGPVGKNREPTRCINTFCSWGHSVQSRKFLCLALWHCC